MKYLDSIITKVTKVEEDSRGNIRINTADTFSYLDHRGMEYDTERDWLYLGFGDTDINLDDYVRIDTYYHLEADMEGDFMFDRKGVHEVVTKLNRPLASNEWADFAYFIASESTHMIGSYPDDGWYHECPYSNMDRAIAAFRCYQRIHEEGIYDWNQVKALRDVDCSYKEPDYGEQEIPEPDYDYEPEYTDNDYYESESDDTLTSSEEAELEESDKFFEKLGLLE